VGGDKNAITPSSDDEDGIRPIRAALTQKDIKAVKAYYSEAELKKFGIV